MIVVDASLAIKWFVAEEGSAEAMRLFEDGPDLVAPDLIVAEMLNILWKKERRGEIDRQQVKQAADGMQTPFLGLVPSADLRFRTAELIHELDHPAYDCLYVACAELLAIPLVTCDARLATRASSLSVEVLLQSREVIDQLTGARR